MSKVRFLGFASALALVVLAALVWLAPVAHGQTRPARAHVYALGDEADGPLVAALQDPGVARVFQMVRDGGEIGVSVRDVPATDAAGGAGGVVVDEVREGSPAATAGFKSGDLVTSFDGERVRSARQFARLVEETPAGRSVKAQVRRGTQTVDLTVTPATREADNMIRREFRVRPGEEFPMRVAPLPRVRPDAAPALPDVDVFMDRPGRLGVSVQELTPELAEYFGVKDGVLVSSVQKDSPAAKAGVKPGDVITSVDGASVDDAAELRRRVWKHEDATEVNLGLTRDKKSLTLKVPVESAKPKRPV